jgi:hypothetical protein
MKLILFSLPRSGSSWLGNIFGKNFKYFPEYFNHSSCTVCNKKAKNYCPYIEKNHEEIRDFFGSLTYWKAIGTITRDVHKKCIEKTWYKQQEWTMTKEVLSFSKINAYRNFYDAAFCLYRNRLMTFPGTSDQKKTKRCFEGIWNSLRLNKQEYNSKIQQMINVNVSSIEDIQYAGHAIASYILLHNCKEEGLNIIEYHNLKSNIEKIPKEFQFNQLQALVEKDMKPSIKNGFIKSEKVYEKITNLMEPEIKDIIMNDYKYFI